jgi:cellulose synthase/poly-beta-1,6-N-acetylglucosamine synthase-like glycosyltransferase
MFKHGLYYIFICIQLILAVYLILPLLLLIIHYVRKLFVGDRSLLDKDPLIKKQFSFAAIVTAHQDTRLIPPLVDSLIKQTYGLIHIYVVADDCDITKMNFDHPRVKLLRPENPLNAKIRSISHAMENFSEPHDVIVIFDSDNLVHPRYFEYLNKYFQQGFLAVQTHMLSKNTGSKYAKLDSMGHIYNTFLEREMRMELNLSSCILGLGIAIETKLYKEIMYNNILGGFDKKLQADLVKAIPQLAFARESIVYDEKVEDGRTLEKQRTRWLFTYFNYFKVNWDIIKTALKRLDGKLLYFGFIMLRPPLILLVGLAFLLSLCNYFINPLFSIIWLLIVLQFALSFILIIATQSKQKGMTRALLHVPLVLLRQSRAIFNMKKAATGFLKTEHSKIVYIEELLKDELS